MTVRLGMLGAAKIAPMALVRPAQRVDGVEVAAVAARDGDRARRFADKHGIPTVHSDYRALLSDPSLDAVYIPLPNGLHAEWTIAALEAGKHVLCEKPFASNAAEAEHVAEVAARTDRVVAEAFHWRYHPMARRMIEIVRSGELGELRHVEARMCVPLPLPRDIRYRWELAGGAVMDVGCYAVSMVRHLSGLEPEVVSARSELLRDRIDRSTRATLAFPGGASGRVTCSLLSRRILSIGARVLGTRGELRALNPTAPQYLPHHVKVRTRSGHQRTERFSRRATYDFQLRDFRDAIVDGTELPTPPSDAVANMRVVDAIYLAAGLPPRGATTKG